MPTAGANKTVKAVKNEETTTTCSRLSGRFRDLGLRLAVHSGSTCAKTSNRLRLAVGVHAGCNAVDGRLRWFDTVSQPHLDALGSKVHPRLSTAHRGHGQPTITRNQLCELGIVLLHQFV